MEENAKKVGKRYTLKDIRIERNMHLLLLAMLVIIIVMTGYNILNSSSFKVYADNTIRRNIEFDSIWIDSEPSDRNVVWDSELPEFVSEDIEYAEKHNIQDIEYEYDSNRINISYILDEWRLNFNNYYDSSTALIRDFSIYKTKNNTIAIYGYSYGYFTRIEIGEESTEEVLTYDANLPFNIDGDDYNSATYIDGYTLLEVNDGFVFYKDGKEISSFNFTDGVIFETVLYDGLIRTTDNSLYIMFVEMVENSPSLRFEKVDDNIEEIVESETIYSDDLSFPIIIKDGEYYAICANNWDDFKKYNMQAEILVNSGNSDLGVSLVPLREHFKSAEFSNDYGVWICNIIFDINGEKFSYQYEFNGYDNSVDLPDNIIEEYTVDVDSIDAMWDVIENIRNEYTVFYDHQRGE